MELPAAASVPAEARGVARRAFGIRMERYSEPGAGAQPYVLGQRVEIRFRIDRRFDRAKTEFPEEQKGILRTEEPAAGFVSRKTDVELDADVHAARCHPR